jgi:hypothetical protein
MKPLWTNITTARVVRWAARLLSVASIAVIAMFVVGEPPVPGRVTAREWGALAFFPLGVVVGMVVAWWREAVGVAIGLGSLACFYIYFVLLTGAAPRGVWFAVFSSPLALFLVAWAMSARGRTASS